MATWDLFFAVKWRQWQPPFLNKLHLHLCSWSFRASGRCLRCRMGSWGLVEMDLHHWRAPLHVLLNSKVAPWVLVWGLGPEAKPTACPQQDTARAKEQFQRQFDSARTGTASTAEGTTSFVATFKTLGAAMFQCGRCFLFCVLFVSYCTAIIDSYYLLLVIVIHPDCLMFIVCLASVWDYMRECSHVVNRFAVRPRVSATRVRTRPIGFLVISIEPSISAAFGEVSQCSCLFF